MRSKYIEGNRRSLSEKEEKEILAPFEKMVEEGRIVTAQEVKKVFDKRDDKGTG